jgi:hypothetical protein
MHQLDMVTYHAHFVQRTLTLEQNKTRKDEFPDAPHMTPRYGWKSASVVERLTWSRFGGPHGKWREPPENGMVGCETSRGR